MFFNKIDRFKIYAPPWMIIGVSFVLMAVVIFLAVLNYNREKNYMGKILQEKGAALIRSFEAGARTGMMGMFGDDARLQTLLQETASQPDISYIALVDKTGMILAHNDTQMIGKAFNDYDFKDKSEPSAKPRWRIIENRKGVTYFEVYRMFLPVLNSSGHMQGHGMMKGMHGRGKNSNWCAPGWMKGMPSDRILDPENRPAIFIGMDVEPFKDAMAEDIRFSIIMALVIFILGLAGVVSLFWAQNYMRSRKLLQDTRAFASEIVTNLPVGIIVISTGYKIIYINEVASRLLDSTTSKMSGCDAKEILPSDFWELHKQISNVQPVIEKELSLTASENKSVPVAVSSTDLVDDDGSFIGFMFILKELSEIKELELRIKRREKLAAIGDLAAGIAHEVRNPLSSIKGYVTYLGSLFDKGSENQKASQLMAEEVDRINRVISELLEFASPSDLKPKETDMKQLINNSLRIVSHEADAAGVRITAKFESELPDMMIDPDRITQVFLNLYINAIQAVGKDGQVLIHAKKIENNIVIEVSDSGKGILPEDQINIFNPYFTTKKNGTGLGLAIVYKIVENHGGTINVQSDKGVGTTFSISLPVNKEARELS